VPLFGYGIGIGTNVGGHILIGRPAFLLAENEWSRVLAESGPILGLAFLVWRTLLTFKLGWLSFIALRRGALLPILLFSSGFVLLIGHYPLDRQQSMQRFGTMMLRGLNASGIAAKLIAPQPFFGKFRGAGGKWLGYIDKFVLFPRQLRASLTKERPSIVHICDHSNAMYGGSAAQTPVVVTCHDLLAVRGALGEETNCPASVTGKILQRWILRCLRRAKVVACVSQATEADARRLVS